MQKHTLSPEELASGDWVWDETLSIFINKEELLNKDVPVEPVPFNEENYKLRQAAYRTVSDPLFMEWQFDRTRDKEIMWRAAVKAIKTKYPLH